MRPFYFLDPQVPGEMGSNAVLVPGGRHPRVEHLHFEFSLPDPEPDDLFQTYPVYLLTLRLADALRHSDLSGFALRSDMEVSVDPQVTLFRPDWRPPAVQWLDVSGKPGVDDFGLTGDGRLVVSARAWSLLEKHRLDHCAVLPST